MEYRQLGNSNIQVPVLCFGTATFGGGNEFFKAWGSTQGEEAKTLVDICIDHGVNFFDTANVYSAGAAEKILGGAISGRRDKVLISTKATFPMGEGPDDFGSSAKHLVKACEESLRRLGTDYIDIYHMHGFDANTPIDETLGALDQLIRSGKIRSIACSNFSGWHLMKSLSISEREGWSKYIAHQVYYSLLNRDYEWELMPLALEEKISAIVWSPLAAGKLSGKYRKGEPLPPNARVAQGGSPVINTPGDEERLYRIVAVLDTLSAETGKTHAQISLNWLLQRPSVSSIIIGARDRVQLIENLESSGWALTAEQITRLDEVSDALPPYPYWHQRQYPMLNSTIRFNQN